MKPLEQKFIKKGWHHVQLVRIGDTALYKRYKDTSPEPHYEVIRIQRHEAREIAGVKITAMEAFPPDSRWGTDGFTFTDLTVAEKKFHEMARQVPRQKASISAPVA